ncbi:hypothetical protein [Streptomyces noursei]|uniref:hypothetical protein n=1 Tax=Streptomyces noursei TaxID=1971 RepID=UPI001678F1E5|nr:hypothetical protein [Streptomyces noursei]MCZ1019730.1 hypothetical protein [Streptomyces noursei]GGX50982.1 hypothetical protein GCM10010341_85690 [Streptomyces noursei]
MPHENDYLNTQVHSLIALFTEKIAAHDNNVNRARHDLGLSELWRFTAPEIRRHLFLTTAWESRDLPVDDLGASTAAPQYASAFTLYAKAWATEYPDTDIDAFCTQHHSARLAASSLAFDRDDLTVSLETALLLTIRTPIPEQW